MLSKFLNELIICQLMSPADSEPLSALEMALAVEEEFCLAIQFDPAYTSDFHSRVAESVLTISYKVSFKENICFVLFEVAHARVNLHILFCSDLSKVIRHDQEVERTFLSRVEILWGDESQ